MNSPEQKAMVSVEPVEYRHFVMVRELGKPGAEIAAYIRPEQAHLLHMAVGLMGEVVELFANTSYENFIEECGDIEFYFVGYLQGINREALHLQPVDPTGYFKNTEHNDLECLLIEAGNLLDITKKFVIYNKPLDDVKVLATLANIKALLEWLYEGMETSRDAILTANLWKLKEGPNARYKKGYSDQAAQLRVDKPTGE